MAVEEAASVDEEVRTQVADDFGSDSSPMEDTAAADATTDAAVSGDDDFDDDDSDTDDAPPPVEVEFSPDVLSKAEFYGFTAEEARYFGTPEALERTLAMIDRRQAAEARAEMERGDTKHEETSPTATTNSAGDGSGAFEKFDLGINPEEFEPEVAKLLTGLNDHYHGLAAKQHSELEALKSQLSQVTGHFEAEAATRISADMDKFFDELPDTFKDVFGKGKLDALAPKGWHAANRIKLWEEMKVLQEVDAKHGRKPRTFQQLQQSALHSLHSDKLKTIARKEVKGEVEARKKQAVARPSSRKEKPLSEDDTLRRIARDWATDKGLNADD